MLVVRAFLAVAMVVVGAIVLVRVGAFGFRVETLPGLVLGAAMVALGLHRLTLMVRLRRGSLR